MRENWGNSIAGEGENDNRKTLNMICNTRLKIQARGVNVYRHLHSLIKYLKVLAIRNEKAEYG